MILLFDLDDTLYPEKTYIYQGFWAVSQFLHAKYGFDLINTYLNLIEIFRKGSKKIFDDFLGIHKIELQSNYLVRIYREAKRNLFLYNDVPYALNYLKNNNRLILLTNGDKETQWKKIKILDLENYFNDILVLDDYGKEYWKPSILILNKIYDRYNHENKFCLIGNAIEDLEFARRAGIDFVFVNRPNNIKKIENTFVERIIINLQELVEMIERR
ncbi:HAD family hydrolase [Caldisericum sp.]|jgi:putative hydrolase of the HAD superfamily|uniref:HAD family hydrolase n=1 Tax=Caldisericum sp. TaxID=2499687 RepID=UPI003D0FC496